MAHAVNMDSEQAHGKVLAVSEQQLTLGVPGTNYRLDLVTTTPVEAAEGSLISGTLRARAKRVDKMNAGGRYIDPVYGRPRRLQGYVTAVDSSANTLTIFCGVPFVCLLTMNQKASSFHVGETVSCDVERGARFEVVSH